jgi:hypothetical protein
MTPNDIPETSRKRMLKVMPKNAVVVEVGVFRGKFAQEIMCITEPKYLLLIDPWIYEQPTKEKWMYVPWGGIKSQADFEQEYRKVVLCLGSIQNVMIRREYSHVVVATIPDNYVDWVYVDGAHDYDSVIEDVTDWYNKIKIGGWICGDDWDWKPEQNCPVKKAVEHLLPTLPHDDWHLDGNQWWFRKT